MVAKQRSRLLREALLCLLVAFPLAVTFSAPRNLDVSETIVVDELGRFEVELTTRAPKSSMLMLDLFGSRIRRVSARVEKLTGRGRRTQTLSRYQLPVTESSIIAATDQERTCLEVAVPEPEDLDLESLPPLETLNLPEGILFRLIPLIRQIIAVLDAQEPHTLPRCDLVPQELQVELTTLLQELFLHHPWTLIDTCEVFNSEYWDHIRYYVENQLAALPEAQSYTEPESYTKQTRSPRSSPRSMVAKSFRIPFLKDECESRASRYTLTLSGRATPNSTLLLVAQERVQESGTSASLKPESDGRFAPEPLLLMEAIGACNLTQNSSVFTRRAVRQTQLTPADLITHDNKLYTRTPLGDLMDGRQASFYLVSPLQMYGVCFRRSPVRQIANGYRLSAFVSDFN